MSDRIRPRLGFVGPMLGINSGWVTSQGEILARLFSEEGYETRVTSTRPQRIVRFLDVTTTMLRWGREIDIIIVMVFSGLGFVMADWGSKIAHLLGKPLVMWLHGGALPEFGFRHPIWVKQVLKRGHVVVSPSPYLAQAFRQMGIDVHVIPNVIKLEDYPYRHRDHVQPRLLWMRTFESGYNPELAIRVLSHLKELGVEATLTMGGQDRGRLGAVQNLAQTMGVADQVRFVGFMNNQAKQREFSDHDIYLSTTRVDNTPVSVVEAAAFGLPIIATAVGGIPYMLQDGETALLVNDDDVVGMSEAVIRLVHTPSLASRLSEKGRELACAYDWVNVRQEWERLFSSLTL
jgi:glycosyltransferase involved in cell wall biosynthesis